MKTKTTKKNWDETRVITGVWVKTLSTYDRLFVKYDIDRIKEKHKDIPTETRTNVLYIILYNIQGVPISKDIPEMSYIIFN